LCVHKDFAVVATTKVVEKTGRLDIEAEKPFKEKKDASYQQG
jgi:hypothetical protein